MTTKSSQEFDRGRPLDIVKLRAACPELDAKLTQMESDAADRFTRLGCTNTCYGVEIAHEGEWALALTRPGSTVTQCSLADNCQGHERLHGHPNESCRIVIGDCPACAPEPPRRTVRSTCSHEDTWRLGLAPRPSLYVVRTYYRHLKRPQANCPRPKPHP